MRNPFAQSVLDEIDIVQLISEDVTLENNKARCPFPDHEDNNPSFTVYPPDGFYCFGCNRGGTAIDYIMHRDGVSAGEAIRILCENYNIPMPDWTPEQQAKSERHKSEKEIVEKISFDSFAFYHDNMTEEQRAYFLSRGLTDETIDKELLGYAPEGNVLFEFAHGKYTPDQLLLSGLFIKVSGGIKDFYRDRYVFPYWRRGQIAYSIGRSLDPDIEEHKKYIKQMTHKDKHPYVSDTVQNIIWNADEVRSFEQGIIAEGIIDGLHAKQIGSEINCGVISPVTKQFRGADIDSLVKLTKAWEVTFIFPDNEESGEGLKGALKTAQTLFEAGRDLRLVMLPRPENIEKVDLADFLNVPQDQRESRVDELKQLMNEAPDFIEWRINEVAELPERDRPKATREIFSLLILIDDRFQLERYAEIMQKARLVKGKRFFWGALKDAKIEQAKKRKQAFLLLLEKESPELFLKAQIKETRKNKYGKSFEIKQDISNIILTDMLERGRFYQTTSPQYFWFDDEAKTLYPIHNDDDPFKALVNERYGINPSENEFAFLVEELKRESFTRGIKTEIHKFAFYDSSNYVLYVYNNNDQIYRLNGKEIKLVANGTDGVLFLKDDDWENFEYKEIGDGDFLHQLIVHPINFVDGDHVNLSKHEQRNIFTIWLYTLFFESIQPTKPIQTFIGPKGSGKTTIQRIVGKMFFGSRFDVTPIAKDDDFDATISNNYIACFDNVDGRIDWLNDRLSHTATGKMIQKRELYTTNKNVRFFPKCFLSLNAREPKFKRDDVVDRLLLFRVERLPSFRSEQSIINDILAQRDELWSELLNDLNGIVAALAQDNEPFTSQHRMADWATLAWRIAKSEGQGDRFLELLEKMDREQSTFLLEDNPIFLCLDIWLADPNNLGREVTASTLYCDFQVIAEREKMSFTFKNTRSFGMHLRNILSNLKEFFDVQAEKKNNKWTYTFNLKTYTS